MIETPLLPGLESSRRRARPMPKSAYPFDPGHKEGTTSRDAAIAIAPYASRLRELVLQALAQKPMTADEVAKHVGETVLAIRPRVSELATMGKIVQSGTRRKNASGRAAHVWRVAA